MGKLPRDSISRAELFLNLAKECSVDEREKYEAFLEASIVFARAAIHRLQSRYKNHPGWQSWWGSMDGDPSVTFFKNERNWLLKDGPPKIHQVIRFGEPASIRADELYYFEEPTTTALMTIHRHLEHIKDVFGEAEAMFTGEQE